MDIKECRAYVRQCIKNYPANSFILELDNYPLVKCVIIHNDNKAWGYFREDKNYISLDRSNNIATGFIYDSPKYKLSRIKNIYIISNDKEVQRVYNELIEEIVVNRNWHAYYLGGFFRCNPRLYTNLWDLCPKEEKLKITPFQIIYCHADITKDNIHKAFNLPIKYALLSLHNAYLDIHKLRLCANNNIPVELIHEVKFEITELADKYITHKLIPYLKDTEIFIDYIDYLNMRERFPESIIKDFPVHPALDRLESLHNKMIVLYNRESQKINALKNVDNNNRYKEHYYSKACKYEYSNKEYSIIACKRMEELVSEGNVLHHCVGSYIDSVSHGKEYILFLRKNTELELPYFTIDIDLNNNVRQIHGKYNCNINDEIRPFIEKWANKFNLDISNCNGVKGALG